jgi:hypothetical protein
MFVDTACSVMSEMSTVMLDMLVFSSSRLRGLLREVTSLMQPHRKKSCGASVGKKGGGGCSPFEIILSPSNRDSSDIVAYAI